MSYKAKAAEYKQEEVNRLKGLIQNYKVIAVADMTSMPSPQLQKLRSSLKGSVVITMSKGRLISLAIESVKGKLKGIENLENHMHGMPALLLTDDNPFKLAKVLKKSKSMAPAKAGQIAPNDILVLAGPTPLPPGPVIGELGAVGIKAGIEEGKIAIKADKVVTKAGEVISPQVAGILSRLGIEPMEIGIHILAAYEEGTIFGKDVLNIDESTFLNNLKLAASNAFNLTIGLGYATKQNIKTLIRKAFVESNALADSKNILTSNNVKKQLGKVSLQAEYLADKLNMPELKESTVTEDKKKPDLEETKKKFEPELKQEVQSFNIEEDKNPYPEPHPIKPHDPIEPKTPDINIDIKLNQAEKKLTQEEEFKLQEAAAQEILKKVQEQKMAKQPDIKIAQKKQSKKIDEAKEVFNKLQEEKIRKAKENNQKDLRVELPADDFKSQEKKAQEVLKKLQEEKIEKEDKEKNKPRGFFDNI